MRYLFSASSKAGAILRSAVHPALAAGALLMLANCSSPAPGGSGEADEERAARPGDADRSAMAQVVASSRMALLPLTRADIEQADLPGELACTFAPTPGGETLLLGRGDVGADASARAVIKLPDGLRVVEMRRRGGFGQMTRGGMFQVQGMQVEIVLTEDALPNRGAGGGEGNVVPAMLDVRARVGGTAVQGVFRCGP